MIRRLNAILLFTVLIVGPFLAQASTLPDHYQGLRSPQAMPEFLIENDKRQTFRIKDFHGKIILLNLWATWCAPCVKEMPSLDKLASQLDSQLFTVIAINENNNGQEAASDFFSRHELHHLHSYVDSSGNVPTLLRLRGLPTTLVVNSDGLEIGQFEGPVDWGAPEMLKFINGLASP